jgi:hypothetical protein
VFGLGPGLEDEMAGRIEDALDNQRPLGHLCRSNISCTHLFSPASK